MDNMVDRIVLNYPHLKEGVFSPLEDKKRREERGGWKQYYNRESNTNSIRKTRQHKQKVYLQDINN